MRIVGNEDDVNIITLKHKGRNVKFRCYSRPFPYMDRTDLEKDKEVEIIFDDLIEVSSLIDMLERFRKEAAKYIGEWR